MLAGAGKSLIDRSNGCTFGVGSVQQRKTKIHLGNVGSKQTIIRTTAESEPSPGADVKQLWQLYSKGNYVEAARQLTQATSFNGRKVLALCLMRLGDLYQAGTIWKQLLEEASPGARGGILLHLGISFLRCWSAVDGVRVFPASQGRGG